jgi:hypothetical protein
MLQNSYLFFGIFIIYLTNNERYKQIILVAHINKMGFSFSYFT